MNHLGSPGDGTHCHRGGLEVPPAVLRAEVARRIWWFGRSDGSEICPMLQLGPRSKIANFSTPNEASWGFDRGDVVFRAESGRITTRFTVAAYDTDARQAMVLSGDFHDEDTHPGLHRLVSLPPFDPKVPPDGSIDMRCDLDAGGDALVVVFNGRGRTFDGERTEFEMGSLGRRLGVDTVGFAELDRRSCWYADKVDVVCLRLAPILARGYRRVVCTGMSLGGFASILFAELLAQAHPDIAFSSVGVNPQTTLDARTIDRVWATAPGHMLPLCIAPDARAACVPCLVDLPAFLATTRHAARHRLLVDGGNPVEAFYASLMKDTQAVRIDQYPLGLTHPDGCIELFQSGRVQAAIEEALAARA